MAISSSMTSSDTLVTMKTRLLRMSRRKRKFNPSQKLLLRFNRNSHNHQINQNTLSNLNNLSQSQLRLKRRSTPKAQLNWLTKSLRQLKKPRLLSLKQTALMRKPLLTRRFPKPPSQSSLSRRASQFQRPSSLKPPSQLLLRHHHKQHQCLMVLQSRRPGLTWSALKHQLSPPCLRQQQLQPPHLHNPNHAQHSQCSPLRLPSRPLRQPLSRPQHRHRRATAGKQLITERRRETSSPRLKMASFMHTSRMSTRRSTPES